MQRTTNCLTLMTVIDNCCVLASALLCSCSLQRQQLGGKCGSAAKNSQAVASLCSTTTRLMTRSSLEHGPLHSCTVWEHGQPVCGRG
jgi:hypothetical protein